MLAPGTPVTSSVRYPASPASAGRQARAAASVGNSTSA